jgi:hypothetical protein
MKTEIKITRLLLILIGLASLIMSSCRDCDDPTNPECPNYVPPVSVDPCAGKEPVTAHYVIESRMNGDDGYIYRESPGILCDDDTSNSYVVRVRATNSNYNHTWIIGSDQINATSYEFSFSGAYCGQNIPITLITTGPIDSTCFPDDNGQDTVTFQLPVIYFFDNPVWGKFRISWDSAPLDSFDVKIFAVPSAIYGSRFYTSNFNHLEQNDSCLMDLINDCHSFANLFNTNSYCRRIMGDFWINPDGSFEADYEMDNDPESGIDHINMVPRHARGRKI